MVHHVAGVPHMESATHGGCPHMLCAPVAVNACSACGKGPSARLVCASAPCTQTQARAWPTHPILSLLLHPAILRVRTHRSCAFALCRLQACLLHAMQWCMSSISPHGCAMRARAPPQALMLCGPKGVGKGSLTALLAADYADRVRLVQLLTTKPCYKGEEDGLSAWVTTHAALVRRACTPLCVCVCSSARAASTLRVC